MSAGTITNDLTGMAGDPAPRWIALAVGVGDLATVLIRVTRRPRPPLHSPRCSSLRSRLLSPRRRRPLLTRRPKGPRRRRP